MSRLPSPEFGEKGVERALQVGSHPSLHTAYTVFQALKEIPKGRSHIALVEGVGRVVFLRHSMPKARRNQPIGLVTGPSFESPRLVVVFLKKVLVSN